MALPREAPALVRRHVRRRCVQCGLSADAIPASSLYECPRCGCDLASRPPRSYAEMEGLFDLPPDPTVEDARRQVNAEAAAARWLVVLLGVAGLSGGALAAAVMLAAR